MLHVDFSFEHLNASSWYCETEPFTLGLLQQWDFVEYRMPIRYSRWVHPVLDLQEERMDQEIGSIAGQHPAALQNDSPGSNYKMSC
jgi:hypothetical protein